MNSALDNTPQFQQTPSKCLRAVCAPCLRLQGKLVSSVNLQEGSHVSQTEAAEQDAVCGSLPTSASLLTREKLSNRHVSLREATDRPFPDKSNQPVQQAELQSSLSLDENKTEVRSKFMERMNF